MSEDITQATSITGPDFESIRHIAPNGEDYWLARELQPLLEYQNWREFEGAVKRARIACIKSGNNEDDHFGEESKMIRTGKGAQRSVKDYHLSKYACYLIAQNSDPRKAPVALAQTYFAVQAQRMEIIQKLLAEENTRLELRYDLEKRHETLQEAAKAAGVNSRTFGIFFDRGYRGFYAMSKAALEKHKGLPEGEDLADFMRSMELASRVSHAGFTEMELSRGGAKTPEEAAQIHESIGRELREPWLKRGMPPEDYPLAEKSIRPLLEEKKKKEKKAKIKPPQGQRTLL